MKKSPEAPEKIRLPLRREIGNNRFLLTEIHRAAPGYIALVLFSAALTGLMSFFSGSFLLRYALNGIGQGKTYAQILALLVGILIATVLSDLFAHIVNIWLLPRFEASVSRRINGALYERAARADLSCYEDPAYYDSFSKAVEECSDQTSQMMTTLSSISSLLTSFSANFGMLTAIDPFLLIFAAVPLLTVPLLARQHTLAYERRMATVEQKRRESYARRTFYLADYAKEMRLTAMPELMLTRFREAGAEVMRIVKTYGLRLWVLGYISGICTNVLMPFGATFYAVWKTLSVGTMGIGDCIVVAGAVSHISGSLLEAFGVLMQFHEHALYIENLRQFLEREIVITGGDTPLPESGDLVMENVRFRYEGSDHDCLHDVNIRIGAKEKIAIVGHNGAGKTTLVKLLLRLYDPTDGRITYGGTDIRDFPVDDYREPFGCVMQDTHLFALSVEENVLGRPACPGDEATVAAALEQSGLRDKIAGFSAGTKTVLTREFDEEGEQLSGGETQKMAIAHVFAGNNRFVILDEPSSALDPIAEHEMYERMAQACRDCGMVFISHRLSSAVTADRVYLMEKGTVLETGTHAELMAKNGRYAEMFRRQAENYGEVSPCHPE